MASELVNHHYIGLDLGQRRDYTVIAVISAVTVQSGQRDPVTFAFPCHEQLRLRHLHRFPLGTPYTSYPGAVRRLLHAIPEPAARTLVVDGSGPGLPVVNMLRDAGLPARLLTAMILNEGSGERRHSGSYTIGRRGTLSAVRVAVESGVLRAASNLPLRHALIQELRSVSIDNDYESGHDDLVFAIALALFGARQRNPSILKPLAA